MKMKTPRIGCLALLPTVLIVLFSFGTASGLLAWISFHQVPDQTFRDALRHHQIIVNEGNRTRAGGVVEATLYGLTISAITSHMMSVTTSFLMSLVAYRIASDWLALQPTQAMDEAQDRYLTPLQYGLLARMCGSANIMAIYETGLHLTGWRQKYTRSKSPIVVKAFLALVGAYVLTHSIGFADFWLHKTAHAVLYPQSSPVAQNDVLNMGIAFNETLCLFNNNTAGSMGCGYNASAVDTWFFGHPEITLLGSLGSANQSADYSIITLASHNNLSIVVRPTAKNYAYAATTFGIQSNCQNLWHTACSTEADLPVMCNSSVFTDWPAGWPQADVNSSSVAGGTGFSVGGQAIPESNITSFSTQPDNATWVIWLSLGWRMTPWWRLATASELSSPLTQPRRHLMPRQDGSTAGLAPQDGHASYSPANRDPYAAIYSPQDGVDQPYIPPAAPPELWVGGSGPGVANDAVVLFDEQSPSPFSRLLARCEIQFHRLDFTHQDGFYWLSSAPTPANKSETMSLLMPLIYEQAIPRLNTNMGAVAQLWRSSEEVMARLSQELPRVLLGWSIGMFKTIPANQATVREQILVSRYSVPALFFFCSLLYIYAFLALSLCIWTNFSKDQPIVVLREGKPHKAVSRLELVALRLSNPLAIVADQFQPPSGSDEAESKLRAELSTKTDAIDMFAPEKNHDRVFVGTRGEGGEQIAPFGVWRADVGERLMKDVEDFSEE